MGVNTGTQNITSAVSVLHLLLRLLSCVLILDIRDPNFEQKSLKARLPSLFPSLCGLALSLPQQGAIP